jgi:hypothetical protein
MLLTVFNCIALSLMPLAPEAPHFETGAVVAATVSGEQNCYPVIARTERGDLFATWTRIAKHGEKPIIVGSFSHDGGRTWAAPTTLIDTPGWGDYDPNIVVDGKRILVYSTTTPIPQPVIDKSEVWMTATENEGQTWSRPTHIALPFNYFVGKRHLGLKLRDGTLAMAFSWDLWAQAGTPARTEGEMDLKSGILLSNDHGMTWTPHGALHIFEPKVLPGAVGGVCEPALVELANGELYMLMRTGTGWIYEARSQDGGLTWSGPRKSKLVGHNAPMALWRSDQEPKEVIVIWDNSPHDRTPLSVAISANGGRSWSAPKTVAQDGAFEVSYPGIVQDTSGMFVAVWQQFLANGGREIRWARFNRAWVLQH